MIVQRGIWQCFHCGKEYSNTILYCEKCKATRKHTENMRRGLGFEGSVPTIKCRSGEELGRRRDIKEKYENNKSKFENIINKYFRYFEKIKLFKEKKKEDSLYYGFDKDGFHYTIRRDKIEQTEK